MAKIRGRVVVLMAGMVVMAHAVGCGCGVGPVDGANSADGGVDFNSVVVGQSSTLTIPFKDSADKSETVMSATITGPDAAAFSVLSTFPISIPAGQQETVQIKFAPTAAGAATATLNLSTASMGISPVPLTGTGVAADAG